MNIIVVVPHRYDPAITVNKKKFFEFVQSLVVLKANRNGRGVGNRISRTCYNSAFA